MSWTSQLSYPGYDLIKYLRSSTHNIVATICLKPRGPDKAHDVLDWSNPGYDMIKYLHTKGHVPRGVPSLQTVPDSLSIVPPASSRHASHLLNCQHLSPAGPNKNNGSNINNRKQ